MANEDTMLGTAKNGFAAILFMAAGTNVYDAISAVNSSPLTAERYGADPAQASSAIEYTVHGIVLSGIYCVVAAVLAHSWWPIIGALLADVYLVWLYRRAIGRAQARGPVDWSGLGG